MSKEKPVDYRFETYDKSLAWFRKLNKIKEAYEKDKTFRDSCYYAKRTGGDYWIIVGKPDLKPNIKY